MKSRRTDIQTKPEGINTSIRVFENVDTGDTIHLAGAMHIGKRSYYQRLGNYLHSLSDGGATVHYEGVSMPNPAFGSTFADKFRIGLLAGALGQQGRERALKRFGLVEQSDSIYIENGWEKHDMTADVLARKIGAVSLLSDVVMGQVKHVVNKVVSYTRTGKQANRRQADVLHRMAALVESGGAAEINNRRDRALILDRNGLALEAATDHLRRHPGSELALLWGEAHIPGMADELIRQGYVEDESRAQKLEAVNVRQAAYGQHVKSISVSRRNRNAA